MTGTLGLAYPSTRAALITAVAAARAAGCLVLVDVNWRPVFWTDHEEARREITGGWEAGAGGQEKEGEHRWGKEVTDVVVEGGDGRSILC